ncbi:DUF4255 domain-containing protein [Roseomonas sp. GCM10028921]
MSNALAIASVTAVLKDLLNNGLIDHDVSASVGNVIVTALPPDRIVTGDTNQNSQLNLFLYQVSPNAAWRNAAMPSRDARGERISNQPLALDLHYLLTAFGAQEFHSEILLGYGMQLLHEVPVLTRDAVRRALAPPSGVPGGGGLPPALQALFTSELAEQVELIKIVPQPMSTEELSKLWAAFQAHYRPSAAYQASVVLIEARATTRAAPPVARRLIHVVPFRRPVIERVRSRATADGPILQNEPILAGHRLVLDGRDLRGDDTLVMIGGLPVAPAEPDLGATQVIVPLPPGLAAGVQGVQVVQRQPMGDPPMPHRGAESNLAAFVLSPRLSAAPAASAATGPDGLVNGTVTLQVDPPVRSAQRTMLLLNAVPPASPPPEPTEPQSAYGCPGAPPPLTSPPSSPPDEATSLTFAIRGVRPGAYLVRVRVDGADSPLGRDAAGRYDQPQLVLP